MLALQTTYIAISPLTRPLAHPHPPPSRYSAADESGEVPAPPVYPGPDSAAYYDATEFIDGTILPSPPGDNNTLGTASLFFAWAKLVDCAARAWPLPRSGCG